MFTGSDGDQLSGCGLAALIDGAPPNPAQCAEADALLAKWAGTRGAHAATAARLASAAPWPGLGPASSP